MFDKIEKKVQDIRQEPEYIRVRYVWSCVGIIMFVVIFIWLITIKINFIQFDTNNTTDNAINALQNNLNNAEKEQNTSIDDLLELKNVDIQETKKEI